MLLWGPNFSSSSENSLLKSKTQKTHSAPWYNSLLIYNTKICLEKVLHTNPFIGLIFFCKQRPGQCRGWYQGTRYSSLILRGSSDVIFELFPNNVQLMLEWGSIINLSGGSQPHSNHLGKFQWQTETSVPKHAPYSGMGNRHRSWIRQQEIPLCQGNSLLGICIRVTAPLPCFSSANSKDFTMIIKLPSISLVLSSIEYKWVNWRTKQLCSLSIVSAQEKSPHSQSHALPTRAEHLLNFEAFFICWCDTHGLSEECVRSLWAFL